MTTTDLESITNLKIGGVTACVGPKTGLNVICSLQVAEHLARETGKGNVLYINTVQPDQFLYSSIRKHINKEFSIKTNDKRITYETSVLGLITADKDNLNNLITENQIKFVIINSWEFASKDYRRKEELIFMILGWLQQHKVTIIVFSESVRQTPLSEKIQRGGGIGKLAAIAQDIKVLTEPLPEPIVSHLFDDLEQEEAEIYNFSWTPLNVQELHNVVYLYCDSYTGWYAKHKYDKWESKCEQVLKLVNDELAERKISIREWVEKNKKVQVRLKAQRNLEKKAQFIKDNDLTDKFPDSNSSNGENSVQLHYGPDKLPIRLEEKNIARELLL